VEGVNWFWPGVLGLFGLLFGSFANVLIWRVPRGESVVSPGSHCPACDHAIRWYDNIPVLSWLLLHARCRDCGEPIAWRYPLVEVASGALWVIAGLRYGVSGQTAAAIVLFYLLLVLSFIDIDTYRLPNPLVGLLAVSGLVASVASQVSGVSLVPLVGTASEGLLSNPLVASLAGGAIGAGLAAGIAGLYGAVRGRSGLGAGDVKLLGAMGLFTGPYVLFALFAGSLVGAIFGLASGKRSGQPVATRRIPFGPFLAAGCVLAVLIGPMAWQAYLRLLGAG
jgi:leader peptidase (prepilin peptidase)/N-methyltransferase